MKTLLALSIAVRNLWLLALVVMLILVLDPGWGLYEATAEAAGGSERLLRGTLALTLVGVLANRMLLREMQMVVLVSGLLLALEIHGGRRLWRGQTR